MMGAQSRPAEQPCHDGQDLSEDRVQASLRGMQTLFLGERRKLTMGALSRPARTALS